MRSCSAIRAADYTMACRFMNSGWDRQIRSACDPVKPTLLFLNEFQNYLNLPIDPETMLVQSRLYGLAMMLAHQHLEQLPMSIRSAVLANARSKIMFQTSADDARVFAREFGRSVTEDDFLNLGAYEVLARLATEDGVNPPVSGTTLPPFAPMGFADECDGDPEHATAEQSRTSRRTSGSAGPEGTAQAQEEAQARRHDVGVSEGDKKPKMKCESKMAMMPTATATPVPITHSGRRVPRSRASSLSFSASSKYLFRIRWLPRRRPTALPCLQNAGWPS